MPYCPITLEPLPDGRKYSEAGLKRLHPRLTHLEVLQYSNDEQLRQARLRSDKMSIQGVQPKLSAVLKVKEASFELVDRGGRYIFKPNPPQYEEVPANEALTMTMAAAVGIKVPMHGLLSAVDESWVYFVKRYDREGRSQKRHVEDFAQLSSLTRETKYNSSLEKVAQLIDQYCTFPAIERPKLAKRLLFCFLTGNEDMHLKNFSLWIRDGVVSLAPAYDFLNTTLVLGNAREETALPLQGKQRNLTRKIWLDYMFAERLRLKSRQIEQILDAFQSAQSVSKELIQNSLLSCERKAAYLQIFEERSSRLGLE